MRRVASDYANVNWQKYVEEVQKKPEGLKSQESLAMRILTPKKSAGKDSQIVVLGHLAKALAMNGNLEEAEKKLQTWKQLAKGQNLKEEVKKKMAPCMTSQGGRGSFFARTSWISRARTPFFWGYLGQFFLGGQFFSDTFLWF